MGAIALLGGSFDPPHRGHLAVAETALFTLPIDMVWWVVAAHNPLKKSNPYAQRLAKTQDFIQNKPCMLVTALEQRYDMPSETIIMLDNMKRDFPSTQFIWLMGIDNLSSFYKWQSYERVLSEVAIALFYRPGYVEYLHEFRQRFKASEVASSELSSGRWCYIPMTGDVISSTYLRHTYEKN